MFKRSFHQKDRVGKLAKPVKRSFSEREKQRMLDKTQRPAVNDADPLPSSPSLTSPIVTVAVGPDQRLFAAHEDVLVHSPFFASVIRDRFFEAAASSRRILLPDEEAEVFSAVLEFLYKGDYYPRLFHDRKRNTWTLEETSNPMESPKLNSPTSNGGGGGGGRAANVESTIYHSGLGDRILRDTAVYCAASRYGLEELQRLALRKQGLQSGIEVSVILRSARFAYENTPDSDSRLRAHYLALIIRSRKTFKRSGTMQVEMEMGGKMFFDLFVAMCNHLDDLVDLGNCKGSPRTI